MTHASQPDSPIGTHEPEALAFTPVPLARYRHDGWTAERQHLFIAMLTQTGVVALAARACGMSAASAYALRKRAGAESWTAAWDAALVEGRHRAFDRAMERGIEGVRTRSIATASTSARATGSTIVRSSPRCATSTVPSRAGRSQEDPRKLDATRAIPVKSSTYRRSARLSVQERYPYETVSTPAARYRACI